MKEPQNNDYFPLAEYQARISRARQAMKANGMDAMLMSTEPNVLYFSGLLDGYWICTMHDDVQLVLITADPSLEPVLLLPNHLLQAAYTSCISDVRCWSQFSGGKTKGSIGTIADTFADLKLTKGRVALEIGPHERPGMSLPFIEDLRAALPGVQWVDSTPALKQLLKIKSPLEIEKFRTACQITCQALKVGLDAMKTGMSEKELTQVIALEMARLSPDVGVSRPWFIFVHATGRGPTAFDGVPTCYRFQKGDAVYIDLGFRYQGYGADMIRCAVFGPPSTDVARYYNAARDANMAAVRYIKPGIKGKDLYAYWTEQVRRLGFAHALEVLEKYDFDMLGHGIGVSTHELPLINSTCEEIFEPGMTMSIEGNVFDQMPFAQTLQALKNEENVVVTATGSEWLTPLPNDLYVIER
jgi:Xaa-Pro dipeptidase